MTLERFSNGIYAGWLDRSLKLPSEVLENPRAAQTLPGATLLLNCTGRVIVRMLLEVRGVPEPCFLYLFRNHSLGRSLRLNYAFHIFRVSQQLQKLGFETLDVLAALRPRRQFLNWESFLIAREILRVTELPSGGQHVFQIHDWIDFDAGVASLVANQLAGFHNAGFIHGDLKTRHILLQSNGNCDPARVVLVDLEKARRISRLFRPVHDLFAARDLVQLLSSLPAYSSSEGVDPLNQAFLEHYFSKRELGPTRRALIQRILALYAPGGILKQGKTLLRCLVEAASDRHRSS